MKNIKTAGWVILLASAGWLAQSLGVFNSWPPIIIGLVIGVSLWVWGWRAERKGKPPKA